MRSVADSIVIAHVMSTVRDNATGEEPFPSETKDTLFIFYLEKITFVSRN